ncbi:iron-sulfur cluster-binding protein [Desulfonema ishimotonii]|uniref:Iron-sulfur cluster-binding protein n=1 Tax=Desulfonema ishimotonii TaxID=45657 RepID=A0A401FWH6_9BACT|nr:LutB/LldF family L-lactate oxidation iron-sulfur protein [Desulfonema ishimotonii]GBC61311.1 iron-sulfur cluster-binding protein [Desulfonema ishimotonii]
MAEITTEKYREGASEALKDKILQNALAGVQGRLGPGTAATYQNLPEGPELRQTAHEIRERAIENLDILLERLAENVRKNGGHVFFAETAQEATDYCLKVARRFDVKRVVKGKSMVTEEIGLNPAMEALGIEVNETDLGEYIVQLAGEHPFHIIAPAIHKTRQQVGALFAEKLGIPYTDDPPELTRAARKALREKFLSADMGVSGCNLACAETGHITTVSNEGNIRMSTTLPRVHVAVMGMERVVANLEDHDILFRLLSRGAAAQKLGGCVTYIGGPGGPEFPDGPEEFHLVILDNGRSRILADPDFREMLCCIRCSACLNVCPVYGKIGGHAYGYPYCGPVGAVVTPLMVGISRAKDLCLGETLCGACQQACSVNINLPRMIRELRARLAEGDPKWDVKPVSRAEKLVYSAWSMLVRHPRLYDLFLRLAAAGQKVLPRKNGMIRRLPGPAGGWTRTRDIRPVSGERFRDRWKKMNS